jgi:hypothetical protein
MDATWVEDPPGNPVIDRGPAGKWDAYAVDNPFLFMDGKALYCFYEGQDKPFETGGHERIGMALSEDGIRWRKSGANPILDTGPAGSWDSVVAKLPVVVRGHEKYYLYYSGRDGNTKQIGLATSPDLVDWTKHADNPVLRSRPQGWDRFLSTHPAPPFEREARFYLLYRGMTGLYRGQGLGLAVSTDLEHWQRVQDGPVIPTSEEIASLAVAETAEGHVGVAQAPTRCYWTSRDLVHWARRDRVRFTGRRVDTLSNPTCFQGRWIVLYEQEDRVYRAVLETPEQNDGLVTPR